MVFARPVPRRSSRHSPSCALTSCVVRWWRNSDRGVAVWAGTRSPQGLAGCARQLVPPARSLLPRLGLNGRQESRGAGRHIHQDHLEAPIKSPHRPHRAERVLWPNPPGSQVHVRPWRQPFRVPTGTEEHHAGCATPLSQHLGCAEGKSSGVRQSRRSGGIRTVRALPEPLSQALYFGCGYIGRRLGHGLTARDSIPMRNDTSRDRASISDWAMANLTPLGNQWGTRTDYEFRTADLGFANFESFSPGICGSPAHDSGRSASRTRTKATMPSASRTSCPAASLV